MGKLQRKFNVKSGHAKPKAKDGKSPRHSLKITATVYHVTRDESFYQTEFRTVDGVKKTKLIGREQFRRPDDRRGHIAQGTRRSA